MQFICKLIYIPIDTNEEDWCTLPTFGGGPFWTQGPEWVTKWNYYSYDNECRDYLYGKHIKDIQAFDTKEDCEYECVPGKIRPTEKIDPLAPFNPFLPMNPMNPFVPMEPPKDLSSEITSTSPTSMELI